MIEEKSKFTVLALSLAVLTLAGISALLSVNKSSVLGENTVKPYTTPSPTTLTSIPCTTVRPLIASCDQTIDNNNRPICAKLRSLYQFYCGTLPSPKPIVIAPTLTPPSPTSTTCKTGINSYQVSGSCCGQNEPNCKQFRSLTVLCYDGYKATRTGSCFTVDQWKNEASQICKGRTSCTPVVTIAPMGTPVPVATATPSKDSQRAVSTIRCGWSCGNCTDLNQVDSGIMCPETKPTKGVFCYNIAGSCKKIGITRN